MGRRARKRARIIKKEGTPHNDSVQKNPPLKTPSPAALDWDRLIEYKIEDQVSLSPESYPRLNFGKFQGRTRLIVGALLLLELGIFMSGVVSFSPYLLGTLLLPLLVVLVCKETYRHWTLWSRALVSGLGISFAVLFFPNLDLAINDSSWWQYALCAGGTFIAALGIGELLLRHPQSQNQPWSIIAYPVSVAILALAGLVATIGTGALIRALFV